MKKAIFIPARLQASRLPNKPLLKINGKELILHVIDRAVETGIKEIYVAAGEEQIINIVKKYGHNAIFTDPNLPSGTDRIHQALTKIDEKFDVIINMQGDVPTISPNIVKETLQAMKNDNVDIATACTKIISSDEINNKNVVKAYADFTKNSISIATDFSRNAYGLSPFYHHIGIYIFKKNALKKFVTLNQSKREKEEKLEQLRALENNMRIELVLTKEKTPVGIDTIDDLKNIENQLSK